jgi:hypothetical protein
MHRWWNRAISESGAGGTLGAVCGIGGGVSGHFDEKVWRILDLSPLLSGKSG